MPLFGKTQPTLNWIPNTEPDLAGYIVYYGTTPGVYTANVNVGLFSTKLMTGLFPIQQWYYFSITAYDNATPPNESIKSAEVRYYVSDPYTREAVPKVICKGG